MSRVSQIVRRLGISGVGFLIASVFLLAFYFAGKGLAEFLTILALIPFTAILAFRSVRHLQRQSLWSVRNRLIFVYALMGVLPIFLLFVLIGVGAWGFTTELAIYLANSALERHIDGLSGAVEDLRHVPADQRNKAASEMQMGYSHYYPGIEFQVRDESGIHRYPAGKSPLQLSDEWKNASGLLVLNGHFYSWSHYADSQQRITVTAPLSDETIENLVPNLGAIALFESSNDEPGRSISATAGSFTTARRRTSASPDGTIDTDESKASPRDPVHRLPPPMGRFDIPISWIASVPHYHLEAPNRPFDGVLWIMSRPSAVFRTVFAKAEPFRGVLYVAFVIVTVLFLVVEAVALLIGISLSRRIIRSVHQLYEGTRRVLLGDFSHRIAARDNDQLGELSRSFNQMTANLERLFAVEKEKERLQTELEIAREVQTQLYPREAPPMRGLRLSVRCDPARMVSGDYYDYQEIANRKLAFAIGDVAGKGISAALLMATLQAALRAQMAQHQPTRTDECTSAPQLDASRVVSQLNQQIYAHTSPEKYATFFFALFDENTRTLIYTNAGHLSPLLFRNGDVLPLDSNGTVIGAFPWAKYDESCLIMKPGDLLVCYTDGITEPENAYGEMFGEERLVDLVQKHSHRDDQEIIRVVLDAVRSWTGSPDLQDDMTLLLAREVQPA